MLMTRQDIENILNVLRKFLETRELPHNKKLKEKAFFFRDTLTSIYNDSDRFSVFDDLNSDSEELARIAFSPELSQINELLNKLNNADELNLSSIKKKFFSKETQENTLLEKKLSMILWDINESDLNALKYSTFSLISFIRQVERKQLDLEKIKIEDLERLHQESSETKSALYQNLLDGQDHFNLTGIASNLKLVGWLTRTNLWKSGKHNKPTIIRDTLASKKLIQTLSLLKKHKVFKTSILGKIYRASDEKRQIMIQAINALNIPTLNEKKDNLKNLINTTIAGKNPIELAIIAKSKALLPKQTAIEITKKLFKDLAKLFNPIKAFLKHIRLTTNKDLEEKTKQVIVSLLDDQESNSKNDQFHRTSGSGFYKSFDHDFKESVDDVVKRLDEATSIRNLGHG